MTADLLLSTVVQQRDLNEVEARALVDGIRVDVTDLGERIGTAYLGRAWVALGYPSWDALCEAEFEQSLDGRTRPASQPLRCGRS